MSPVSITAAVVLLWTGCVTAQISYSKDWEVVRSGRNKIIKCTVDSSISLSSSPLHLYRGKPGEIIRRIMQFPAGSTSATNENDIPARFNGRIRGQIMSLTISGIQPEDAATYYCAVWKGDEKVFGSGTRLYVTGENVKPPILSAYPMSKTRDGKRVAVCEARGMFPDLVKFTWKDQSGKKVELSAKEDLLEQKDSKEVRVTSMLIIEQEKASSNTFNCSVQHDSSETKEQSVVIPASTDEEEKQPATDPNSDPRPTCPPPKEKEDKEEEEQQQQAEGHGSTGMVRKLYLFSVTYMALLGKNVVYFCAVCVLLYKRRAGNSEPVSSESPRPGQVNKK